MLHPRHWFLFALVIPVLSAVPSRGEASCSIGKMAEFPVTITGLRPVIQVKFNGSDAALLVDSGAFYSMLSPASASKLRLKTSPVGVKFRIVGPDGEFVPQVATIKQFSLANVPLNNIQFLVGGADLGVGDGAVGLLGQNILGLADVEYDLGHGVIRLMKPKDCGQAPLAYWAGTASTPYGVIDIDPGAKARPIHTIGDALLNGAHIRIVFDTGATTSMLKLAVARQAGIKPDSPDVVPVDKSSWVGTFASFKIDTEEMHNVRIRFGDVPVDDADMLLGADFFLSHRIYVANSQNKLYITYNGGPPFDIASAFSSTIEPGLRGIKVDQPGQVPYANQGNSNMAGSGMTNGIPMDSQR